MLFDGGAGSVHQRVGRGEVQRVVVAGRRCGPGRRRGRRPAGGPRRAGCRPAPPRPARRAWGRWGRSSTTGSLPSSRRPRWAHSASRGNAAIDPPPRSASSRSAMASTRLAPVPTRASTVGTIGGGPTVRARVRTPTRKLGIAGGDLRLRRPSASPSAPGIRPASSPNHAAGGRRRRARRRAMR